MKKVVFTLFVFLMGGSFSVNAQDFAPQTGEPVSALPPVLQQELNQLPAVSVGTEKLKFEFTGDNWTAKLNNRNFMMGTIVTQNTNEGVLLTLNQTHVYPKRDIPIISAIIKTKWIQKTEHEIFLEYKAGPPPSLSFVSRPQGVPAAAPAQPEQPVVPEMVRINGGTFIMGSPDDEPGRNANDNPQRQITVNSFYIGKYPVTQKEYHEIMGENPSQFKGDNLPVDYVRWFEAVDYCIRRSRREGLTPAYARSGDHVTLNRDANGYRLPTEAEWEYACRAGTTTAYNTGADVSNNTGWYNDNSGGKTQVVGQKPANAWGLYDMHGNVWEWCWDRFRDFSNTERTQHMLRGGSWSNSASFVRSACRRPENPFSRRSSYGFRVVRPL
ncbi:MAG: formylglycine-generating enzyme family protein [Treponema sp.]|nr:formylglycine-generating enzyme family protein [Treponema sp.]